MASRTTLRRIGAALNAKPFAAVKPTGTQRTSATAAVAASNLPKNVQEEILVCDIV